MSVYAPSVHQNWFTVSEDYVVNTTSPSAALARRGRGQSMWETWPGSEEVFKPIYEAARRDGHAEAIVMHEGNVTHMDITAIARGYLVQYLILDVIDVTTTASLAASLARYEGWLSGHPPDQAAGQPERVEHGLRLVPSA